MGKQRNRNDKPWAILGFKPGRVSGGEAHPLRSKVRLGASFDSGKLMGDLISLGRVDLSAEIDLPPIGATPSALREAHLLGGKGELDQRKRIMRQYPRLIKRRAWQQGQKQRPRTTDVDYDEMQDELQGLQKKATRKCGEGLERLRRGLELETERRRTLIEPQVGLDNRLVKSWDNIGRTIRPRAEQLASFWSAADERFRRFLRQYPDFRNIMPDPRPKMGHFWFLLIGFFFVEVACNFIFLASPSGGGDAGTAEAAQPGLIELLLLPAGFAFVNILIAYYGGGLTHRLWILGTPRARWTAAGVGAAASFLAAVFVLVLAHVRDFVSHGRALSELSVSGIFGKIFSSQVFDLGFEAGVLCLLTGILFAVAFGHSQRSVDQIAKLFRQEWTRRHSSRRAFNEFLETELHTPCSQLLDAYGEAITHLSQEVVDAANPLREYSVRARHEADDLKRRWEDFTEDAGKAIRLYRSHNIEARQARRWFGLLRSEPTEAPDYYKKNPQEGFTKPEDNSADLQRLQAEFVQEMRERGDALKTMVADLPEKEKALKEFCANYRAELLKEARLADHDSEFVAGDLSTDDDLGENAVRFPDRRR